MYLPTNFKNTQAKIDATEKKNRQINNQNWKFYHFSHGD